MKSYKELIEEVQCIISLTGTAPAREVEEIEEEYEFEYSKDDAINLMNAVAVLSSPMFEALGSHDAAVADVGMSQMAATKQRMADTHLKTIVDMMPGFLKKTGISDDIWAQAVTMAANEKKLVKLDSKGDVVPDYERIMSLWKDIIEKETGYRPKASKGQKMGEHIEAIREEIASKAAELEGKQIPPNLQRAIKVFGVKVKKSKK